MYNINAMLPRIATYLGNEWSVSTPPRPPPPPPVGSCF